ncbi:unnamed protein product [Prorocentrum cordatum]|uniref:Uncharacterized protein n=1 Tax=Prorocentrum cordatum TaxID=2364126 RepID=A0ABN9SN46_9DINO|nr:unnamed protein product [Polarella glacialis]
MHALFVQRAVETLENFLALVDSLPDDVVVRAEIADTYSEAAAGARRAVSEAASGDLAGPSPRGCPQGTRAGPRDLPRRHRCGRHVLFVGVQVRAPLDLPLCLPIAMPICIGLWRQAKHARAARALRLRGASEVS